jgi:tetratricopeptide (TPR) repeat protein
MAIFVLLYLAFPANEGNAAELQKPHQSTGTALRQETATQDNRASGSSSQAEALPELPKDWASAHGFLKGGVTESHRLDSVADQQTVSKLAKAKDDVVYDRANQALKSGKYSLAAKLYEMLGARKPKDARYFYGAAIAYRMQGDIYDAFPNSFIAWHVGDLPIYKETADSLVAELQPKLDRDFKLTWGYGATDPGAVVNAGARMWKIGLTRQSIQLFEYALKNEPLYSAVAAFDLGAVAERDGDLKLAARYYKWAAAQSHKLEAEAMKSPQLYGEISKAFKQLPTWYIEQAVTDVEHELKGNVFVWRGWSQATQLPKQGGSEICPLCTISRTHPERIGLQGEFVP